jgi:hypothetical protein
MVYMRNIYNILDGKTGRDHSENGGVDGKILKWILGKYSGKVWTACIWLSIGTRGGPL